MFIVECPHCGLCVEIEKVNCGIFRHGIFQKSGKQVPPHAPKEVCDKLLRENKIYGCSKPFAVKQNSSGTWIAEICDYI